ncbi:MAG: ocd [Homoserinimonas sp.]|nr:ocd [Homoserinimonas sp.]
MRVFSAADVRANVTMPTAIEAVRHAFLAYAAGEFQMPVRTSLAAGTILIMPVLHTPTGAAAIKTLNVQLNRRPAISGVVVWSDAHGEVVIDASEITSIRTGAVTGLATDLLADKDSRRLVLIGAGGQAMDQLRAVMAVRDLEHVTVSSRTLASARALAESVRGEYPRVRVEATVDPSSALRQADIVCCATSSSSPVFDAADLPERVHVNGIGSYTPAMRELPQELLATAHIVVDDLAAAKEEAGEIIDAISSGLVATTSIQQLGQALTVAQPATGRTVFKSVGLAIQDWAVAGLLAKQS